MLERRPRLKPFLYALTAAISFAAFFFADKLWHADIHVPFAYASYGDAIEPQMKQLQDGGWFFDPYLEAPFGQNSRAIAQLNTLKWGIRWILVELTHSPFTAQNLFEMLSPVLSSLTFLYAARRLGLSFAAAIPCAVLFANLYELYWRVLAGHALQGAYWMTPLGCLVLLWIARGVSLTKEGARFLLSRDGTAVVVIAALIGMESHYEVFFASTLALVAILIGCIQQKNTVSLRTGAAFIGVMALSFFINFSPTLSWKILHHASGYPYSRLPVEAYLYSLSIGQMILPNPDHRIAELARIRARFDGVLPILVNENKAATLGAIATFGLGALFVGVIARGYWKVPRVVQHSAFLTIAAMLLATTGSIGAVINALITPDIRAYNRISTWIAFFCLLAVAYLLQIFWGWAQRHGRTSFYAAFACALMVLGVLDQSPSHPPPYAAGIQSAKDDRIWTDRIVAELPPKARILELPYVDDLEIPLAQLELVSYMYSSNLRYSVGAWRGSQHSPFEEWLATLPPGRQVAAAMLSGFDAILVFRNQLPRGGSDVVEGLTKIAGPPTVGEGGSQLLFSLDRLVGAARAADPAVHTPQGLDEALAIFQKSAPEGALNRIEAALNARAATLRAESRQS